MSYLDLSPIDEFVVNFGLVVTIMCGPSSQIILQIRKIMDDHVGAVGQVAIAEARAEILEDSLELFVLDNSCLELVWIVLFDITDGVVDASNPLENSIVHKRLPFWRRK